MVKNIKHYQLNLSKLLKDQHVPVKSFPGATIRSVMRYIQPMLKENQSDKILLHVGTNDLSSAKNANEIASKLMDTCRRLKIDVTVSEIASCGDDLINVKGKAVNKCLKEMCKSKNVWLLEHTNIIPGTHLEWNYT